MSIITKMPNGRRRMTLGHQRKSKAVAAPAAKPVPVPSAAPSAPTGGGLAPAANPKIKKNKVGQNLGLNRAIVVEKGLTFYEKMPGFSLVELAVVVGASRTGLVQYLKGPPNPMACLHDAMAMSLLAGAARPVQPGDTPELYIRDVFRDFRRASSRYPQFATMIPALLSRNRLLNSRLPERLGTIIEAAVPTERVLDGVDLVMAALVGFLALEFPHVDHPPAQNSDDIRSRIAALPAGEHPFLNAHRDGLSGRAAERLAERGLESAGTDRADQHAAMAVSGVRALVVSP